MSIPYYVLKQTTEEFSDKHMIGSGGYGKVYKGDYNGEHIAIKLFYDVPALDNKAFENEFFNIRKIQHPNVVRLVGYCYETQHKHIEYNGVLRFAQYINRILCFELMHGGSLDKYLNESRDHDWPTCYNIIKGTCEGLNFLHTGCEPQILHLDLKPANILLDKDMRAKLGDLGLARFFSTQTQITNTTIGTEDYMPPEFISKKQISPKNDVYSLGVIIIDILAGHKGYSEVREMDDVKPFVEKVIMNWREWIYATSSPLPSEELNQVETCIKIAIKSVDPERKNRPTVEEIMYILQETEKRFHLLGQSLPTPSKSGLRGGMGGNICDIIEKPWRLTSLTIYCAKIIDAFSFSYIDQSWNKQYVGPWGTDHSKKNAETIFFGPSEFVEEVSGTYGSYRGITRVRLSNPTMSGPWGGSGGGARDINEKPWRLTSLTVSYISKGKGIIDAFSFSYIDQVGKKQNVGPWGDGNHWDTTKTIRFGPSEFLKEISGSYGKHNTCPCIVKFLTFITNVRTYGPFGSPNHPGPGVSPTPFRFVVDEGSSIVGFHGRSGRYIDAIGVYTMRVTE